MKACVLFRTNPGTSRNVVRAAKGLGGTTTCFATFGRTDVIAFVDVNDAEALAEYVVEASRIEGVVGTETLPELEAS